MRYRCQKRPVRTADQGRYIVRDVTNKTAGVITITTDGAEFDCQREDGKR